MLKTKNLNAPLQKAYEESLEIDKIQLTQVCTLSGILVIMASVSIDIWGIPSSIFDLLIIRIIASFTLVLTFCTTFYKDFFIRNYTNILQFTFLLVAFPFEYSIYLSQSSELAYYTYFAAIPIIIMVLFSWTYMSLIRVSLITAAIIAGYFLAIIMRDDHGPHGSIPLLIVTVSIIFAAIFMGFLGRMFRDKHLHEKFLLQQKFKTISEVKTKEAEAHEYYANHDSLTKLPNRRYIDRNLGQQLHKIHQQNKYMVFMFLDLNGFKKINDVYGHDAGDEVLKVTGNRLKNCIKSKDLLIRLGGDEFLICLVFTQDASKQSENIIKTDKKIIENLQTRIRASLTQTIIYNEHELHISTSIGIATSQPNENDVYSLISKADKRMYEDKMNSKKQTDNYKVNNI